MQTAIATASYAGDFERCRLLCDSIDRRSSGFTTHYILVEPADVALFRQMEGPRRRIVDERALLPSWLKVVPDPLTLGRRRVWLSPKGPPLRGWHVQQLRKIAFAAGMEEDAVLFCDSDTVFVREIAAASLWHGEALHFYREPGALGPDMAEHRKWARRAAQLLGLPDETPSDTDYIAQTLAWRADSARAMVQRIEAVTGRSFVAALAARRAFSECFVYGRFVEEGEGRPDRHAPSTIPICHTYWTGTRPDAAALRGFVAKARADQPAVGIQSFIGTDVDLIRSAAGLA